MGIEKAFSESGNILGSSLKKKTFVHIVERTQCKNINIVLTLKSCFSKTTKCKIYHF